MVSKKIIVVLLFIVALTGCTNSNKAFVNKLSGKIVFATNRIDLASTRLKSLADEFMKNNPGTDVSFEGIKDYDQAMQIRVSAGETPDIYYFLPIISKSSFSDYYLPIDELGFTKDSIAFYANGEGEDGKLYGITEALSYAGIVYNKKAFQKSGIKTTPKTIKEFYVVCEQLKAKGITPLGTAFKDQWPLYPWSGIDYVVAVQTGSIQHKFQYAKQDKIIDSVLKNSFDLIRDLDLKGYVEKDLVSSSWDGLKSDMAQANIGMYYSETWVPPQIVENGAKLEDIGMFPYPGSKAILATGGKTWGVSKDTKAPELAKVFLKYLMADGKLAKEENVISSIKGVAPSQPFVKELLSCGLPVIEDEPSDKTYIEMINKSELNLDAVLQGYILASDKTEAEKIINIANEKWAHVH